MNNIVQLEFYTTTPYPCSYLEGQVARSEVATPTHLIDTQTYGTLVRAGFRRSGVYTYRPRCDNCCRCLPARLPVADFAPDRSQRRAWKLHSGLIPREVPLIFDEAHYALYVRYQSHRHGEDGNEADSREQYTHFLLQSRIDTRMIEFCDGDVLRAVSVIDVLPDGLSSVYTFFDPDRRGSFGTWCVLWQIDRCLRLGLPFLYLGYWIAESPKMSYKANFRPLEILVDGLWQTLPE